MAKENEDRLGCGHGIHYDDCCKNPCEDYCEDYFEDYGNHCKKYGGYCYDHDECSYKKGKKTCGKC